ncbi:phosphatidate cytidylyltransferase [Rhizobium subbaraonis]|uniref:Phosphatidate cytidylyltransferase n=1 Tax=Rhizobium subbaraonis TaxID=908946 RepID=A0A285UAI4_9HYPH|nr:phosphatidate cytidylyltransferase [Rhizobium subbaraonis]SOC38743.1 phosphatidate cytidylyltransferase [Rhizobium subbaraonis]
MSTELRLRIISAVVLAIVVLAATWAGGFPFRLLAAAMALLVYYEWSTITRLGAVDPRGNAFGWAATALAAVLTVSGEGVLALVTVAVATVLSLAHTAIFKKSYWLPGGIAYAGLTALSLAAIRADDDTGLIAMLFVFAVVWATDILAYFVGRAIGGPKLAPSTSPGKTWSGAIGGTVSAIVAGSALYLSFFAWPGIWIVLIALVLSVCSQVGDLFESFIKRRFGVKDSSRLIPGHGGVMDRVDGLVFACFAAFLLGLAAMATGRPVASTGAFLLGL